MNEYFIKFEYYNNLKEKIEVVSEIVEGLTPDNAYNDLRCRYRVPANKAMLLDIHKI